MDDIIIIRAYPWKEKAVITYFWPTHKNQLLVTCRKYRVKTVNIQVLYNKNVVYTQVYMGNIKQVVQNQ